MSMLTKIAGYSEQSKKKITQVNFHKTLEERLLRVVENLEKAGCDGPIDPRWLRIAATHFQEGFMALNRSVMQPGRLSDEDLERWLDERYPT